MKFDFKNANKEQKEAIETINGPLLIIAGPGTGKTFTLINRALNLIINHDVKPSEIFFATFTEKSANELISRLSNELNKRKIDVNLNDMYIGTFHSICLRLLKDNLQYTTLSKNFDLYDEFDQKYFIYRNYDEFAKIDGFDSHISGGTFWDRCDDIAKYLNRLQEELVDYNKLMESNNLSFKFYGNLLIKYNELKQKNNFIDFSSIQVETYNMLINNPAVLKQLREQIKYIMIDEYQDTNHVQEKLTFLMGGDTKNICVVGDDDQAIYRFRGATVRNILEFPKHFKNYKQVMLKQNYRSNHDIINFYNEWMDTTEGRDFKFNWDIYRYDKCIVPAKKDTTKEYSVLKVTTKEKDYINEKIYNLICDLKESKKIKDYNQIAFLFRSVKNSDVIDLARYLESRGIAIYSPRSNMFFERKEIKTITGAMLYLFPRYLNFLGTEEGDKVVLKKYYLSCLSCIQPYLKDVNNKGLLEFVKHYAREHTYLKENLDYCFSGLAYKLMKFEPFSSMLSIDLTKGITDSRTSRNLGIFLNLLIKFESLNKLSVFTTKNIDFIVKRLFNTYFKFLHEGGISEYEDTEDYAPSGCISFLTIHQSKGLEFPIVVVGSQSSVPRKQYDEELENIISLYSGRGSFEPIELTKYFDFWRLFYVAFSRAQSLLVLMADESKNNEPSKYFEYYYKYLPLEVNFANFDFETIKGSKLKRSFSFTSDINAYETCPLQYLYFNELGFGTVRTGAVLFGTVVHQTIEDINKAIIRNEYDSITDENIEKWFTVNYQTASKLNNFYLVDKQQKKALEQILNYKKKITGKFNCIKQAELPISISNEKYNINGKVDLIAYNDGQYEIIDFKTEKKPDLVKEKDKLNRVRAQLEIYAYLIEKRYGIKVGCMKVYYTTELEGNPFVTFQRDEKHIKETIKIFDNVVKKIETKQFNHRCSDPKVCRNCDLKYYCKKG